MLKRHFSRRKGGCGHTESELECNKWFIFCSLGFSELVFVANVIMDFEAWH